uniref:SnoaL-like domain-containing protein n=1 Tax=Lotharella oceanica TaxID=641309 RepID=A0A7S2TTQ6_9EUKA|mmetsp:Transcript_29500/g.55198  ORF Transcript_29500/g.55198 Transcript_29500/m.55198 type:complete len:175 (+) Transcript_29500:63-587(+)|eukprot:CAMPEP_0170171786 /NCGR_PEP_ID=MMETSP0040_2-20121228/4966_1 /TAXON_ID=641309 /ORGANISM="Lotharella oceanica, Strain CCMP622" /LENGTH=174 /DNA_ID=CAMNT_0010412055 /DNA_START=15 /DNA_END=542 /DNA_ORIENTATION=+
MQTKFDANALVTMAKKEVVDVHIFFTEWFSGTGQFAKITEEKKEEAFAAFLTRFHDNFCYVLPGGKKVGMPYLKGIGKAFGFNKDFRIKVENIQVKPIPGCENAALSGTYEEYQTGAKNSEKNNGRRTTVIFLVKEEALQWYQIHETWMPKEDLEKVDFAKLFGHQGNCETKSS